MSATAQGFDAAAIRAVLVEDDEFVRSVVMRQLASLGVTQVQAAADWPIARAILRADPGCNLVISDLDMPGALGSKFLQELAEIAPGVALIISSSLDAMILQSAVKQASKLSLNVLGSIPKPTSPQKLSALLALMRPG